MNNKIQELTDKLYQEGLSKGKEAGEQILENARKEAEGIVGAARKEAEDILSKAQKDAADLAAKAESDVRMASRQAIQATRSDIEDLVIARIASDKVGEALSDGKYLKDIIKAVAERFSAQEAGDIALVLPEALRSELEPFVSGELAKAVGKGVQSEFSKKISGGFTIAPKDGGYFISMTDDSFKDLISEYLRPVTRKLLFGE